MPTIVLSPRNTILVLDEKKSSVEVTNLTQNPVISPTITEIHVTPPILTRVIEINQGPAGPPGPPGTGGGSSNLEIQAGMNLSGHKCVKITQLGALYVDSTQINDALLGVGITLGAVSLGDMATIRTLGPIEEPSWSWTPNQLIFLGQNGGLTQVVPTSANSLFSQPLGYAISPTSMYVDIGEAITLIP